MTDRNNERTLIINIAKGDAYAFEEVFNKYNRRIFTFSIRYLKNKEDAEGVVQEVFMSLWQNADKLRKDSNLQAYIFTITFNAIRKRFRKLSREKNHLKNYFQSDSDKVDEISEVEYYDLLTTVTNLIDKLPPRQKKVLLLRQEEGLTNAEIAHQLKISKKTVENHLHTARSILRKAMEEKGLLSLLFFWLFIH